MFCTKCKIRMKVHNTYKVNHEVHTARHECPKCGKVCTSVTMKVCDAEDRGQGAYSLAKNMKQKSTALKAVQKGVQDSF